MSRTSHSRTVLHLALAPVHDHSTPDPAHIPEWSEHALPVAQPQSNWSGHHRLHGPGTAALKQYYLQLPLWLLWDHTAHSAHSNMHPLQAGACPGAGTACSTCPRVAGPGPCQHSAHASHSWQATLGPRCRWCMHSGMYTGSSMERMHTGMHSWRIVGGRAPPRLAGAKAAAGFCGQLPPPTPSPSTSPCHWYGCWLLQVVPTHRRQQRGQWLRAVPAHCYLLWCPPAVAEGTSCSCWNGHCVQYGHRAGPACDTWGHPAHPTCCLWVHSKTMDSTGTKW